jgi:hypothetical protein
MEEVVVPDIAPEAPSRPATEPQVQQAPPPSAYDRKLSKLAEKEASIRAMKDEAESLKSKFAPLQDLMTNPKANALKLIENLGLSFEDIADAVLNADIPEDPVQKRLEALEKERQAEKQAIQNKETEALISDYKKLIHQESQAFELVNLTNSQELVFDTIGEVWKKTGRLMEPQEALKMIENELQANLESQFTLYTKSSKLQKLLQKEPEKTESQPDKRHHSSRTLTQQFQSQVSPTNDQGLTREQRRHRAIEMLKKQNQGV